VRDSASQAVGAVPDEQVAQRSDGRPIA
jgi:hypothetical protein